MFEYPNLPNARGYLEVIREYHPGVLHLSGWMLSLQGPFDHVWVQTEQGVTAAEGPWQRPDVGTAFPHIPDAAGCGFSLSLPLPALGPGRRFEFAVVGSRSATPVAQLTGAYFPLCPPPPTPPQALLFRVSGNRSADYFRALGMKNCSDFLRYAGLREPPASGGQVLDWGCGCGRLVPYLTSALPGWQVHGADVDAEAIAWCNVSYPNAHFVVCGLHPPLPYASSSFDLIIAASVFTHLKREHQHQWLLDLERVLKPRAILLATTQGESYGRFEFPNPEQFAAAFRDGLEDHRADTTLDDLAPPDYYRSTWQSRAYTFASWGRVFNIIDYVEAGHGNVQDVFVLRKRS
jgi:hypothetical protein